MFFRTWLVSCIRVISFLPGLILNEMQFKNIRLQFQDSSCFELQIFLNLNKRIYLGISVTYDRNTRLVTCANNSQHKVHFNFSRIQPRYSTKPRSDSRLSQVKWGHLRSTRTFCSGIHIIIYTKYKINNARRKFDRYQTRITAGGLRREIRCDTYQWFKCTDWNIWWCWKMGSSWSI